MTYNVFGGTLNLAHSLTYEPRDIRRHEDLKITGASTKDQAVCYRNYGCGISTIYYITLKLC